MKNLNSIVSILNELLLIESFTNSCEEEKASIWIEEFFKNIPYFAERPNLYGRYAVPKDPHDRSIPYGLILGESKNTVVCMGHFDVVSVEEYGVFAPYAFKPDKLYDAFKNSEVNVSDEETLRDLNSGEWLFARGSADMKGGMAIQLALLQSYAAEEDKPGNLLFIGVPDEETYSAGMRAALKLLCQLKEEHNLDYKLLICPEPNICTDGKQVVSTGSVGKCMPVIMTQGVKAHVGRCFEGVSSVNMLTEIFRDTELSAKFIDSAMGQVSMPPCWTFLRDGKREYDVSMPYRSWGSLSIQSLDRTPDQILAMLKGTCQISLERCMSNIEQAYNDCKQQATDFNAKKATYKPIVMTYDELMLKLQDNTAFKKQYEATHKQVEEDFNAGKLNFAEATAVLMEVLLTHSCFQSPVVLIAFAPPYYPAANSSCEIDSYFNFLTSEAKKEGVMVLREHYFTGISDLSYCAGVKPFNHSAYKCNTPMWGNAYSIDFNAMDIINIPSIILGPWGKDLHKMTERVNIDSLTKIMPKIMDSLHNFIWKKQ